MKINENDVNVFFEEGGDLVFLDTRGAIILRVYKEDLITLKEFLENEK